MREFNEYERSIIRVINDYYENNVTPIYIDGIIEKMGIIHKNLKIDFDKKEAYLKIDIEYYKRIKVDAIMVVRNFNKALITIINVINTLEEYGLLISYFESEPVKTGIKEYGDLTDEENNKAIISQIWDTKTINALIDFNAKSISSDKQLSNFVKRGFKTKEEKTREDEIKIALIALISSTIFVVIGLVIALIDLYHHSTEINILEKIYHVIRCCHY